MQLVWLLAVISLPFAAAALCTCRKKKPSSSRKASISAGSPMGDLGEGLMNTTVTMNESDPLLTPRTVRPPIALELKASPPASSKSSTQSPQSHSASLESEFDRTEAGEDLECGEESQVQQSFTGEISREVSMEESSALAACAEVSALTSVSRLTFHHLLSSCKPLFSVSVDVAAAFCKTVGDACAVRSQNRMAAGDPIVRECVGLMIAHPGCMEVEEGAIRALGFLSSAHPPVVLGLLRSQPPAVVPALTCCALLESLTFPSPSDFDAAVDACAPFLDSPDVDLAYCAALVGSCAGRAENKLAATERSVRLAVTILSSCSDRNVSLHAIRAVGLLCSPTRDGVEGVYLPPLCASAVSSLLPCFAVGVEECEAVCEAVAAVASGTNGCEELVKAGVLPRVFAAMDAWPANDRVQAGSCLLLARVCKQTSSGRYSVVAHGGLGRVYSGLQACAASAPVQLAGLEALAELCCEEDCTLTFLRSNGVDSVVYPAMDAHLQSIPVQQAACRVLDRVANTAEGLRVLGEGRGLEVLKRVRQVHPRHKVMHTGASPVIAKLLASK